jgi:hypothetical protein
MGLRLMLRIGVKLEGVVMQTSHMVLTVLLTLGTAAAVTTNAAEARRYNNYVVSAADCGIVRPPPTLYIFPAANWEPFFRRHFYRYGPILACAFDRTNLVSVRY